MVFFSFYHFYFLPPFTLEIELDFFFLPFPLPAVFPLPKPALPPDGGFCFGTVFSKSAAFSVSNFVDAVFLAVSAESLAVSAESRAATCDV